MVITEAILHIMDIDNESVVFANEMIDLSEHEIYQYIEGIMTKLYHQDAKSGVLEEDNPVWQMFQTQTFIPATIDAISLWHDVSRGIEDLPTGDYMVARFEEQGEHFIGLVKLVHKPQMTHYLDYDESGIVNRLVVNKTVLPTATSKLDEAILLAEDRRYRLIEKVYKVDGKRSPYLGERFLHIEAPKQSIEASLKEVKKVVKSISQTLPEEEYETSARLQDAVYESAIEGEFNVEEIGDKVFAGQVSAKETFREKMEEKQITSQPMIDNERFVRRCEKQKFKLDNGIEISIPIEVYQDKDAVEFINQPDGTLSVIIKNIEDIKNKF